MRSHSASGFALFTLLGGLLGAGCSPSLEADVHDLAITWPHLGFAAAPAATPGTTLHTTQSFDIDATSAGWPSQLNADVRAVSVRFHPVAGVADLGFVQSATASLANKDGVDATEIMRFERGSAADAGPDVVVTNPQPVDITRVWSSQHVRIDITVVGTLPSRAWTMSMTLELSGRLSYAL